MTVSKEEHNIEIHFYDEVVEKIGLSQIKGNIPIGVVAGPIDVLLKEAGEKVKFLNTALKEIGNSPSYVQKKDFLSAEIETTKDLSNHIEKELVTIYPQAFKFFLEGLPHYISGFGIVLPLNLMRPFREFMLKKLIYQNGSLISCHGVIEIMRMDDEVLGVTYNHHAWDDASVVFDSGEKIQLKKAPDEEGRPSVTIMENATIKLGEVSIYYDNPESEIRWSR